VSSSIPAPPRHEVLPLTVRRIERTGLHLSPITAGSTPPMDGLVGVGRNFPARPYQFGSSDKRRNGPPRRGGVVPGATLPTNTRAFDLGNLGPCAPPPHRIISPDFTRLFSSPCKLENGFGTGREGQARRWLGGIQKWPLVPVQLEKFPPVSRRKLQFQRRQPITISISQPPPVDKKRNRWPSIGPSGRRRREHGR